MFEIITTKDSGPSMGSLVVTIEKVGDRFAHSVWLLVNQQRVKILSSLEGTDEQESPPSPPIQDLSVEQRSESQVALGVGMAGTSHWSISIETLGNQGRVIFDVACHARAALPKFCSTYQIESGIEAICSEMECQLLVTELGSQWKVRLNPVSVGENAGCLNSCGTNQFEVIGSSPNPEKVGDKGRWIYELSLCEMA